MFCLFLSYPQLKNRALYVLSQQFSKSQLDNYVSYCLKSSNLWNATELTAIPIQLLKGRLDLFFQIFSASLKEENWQHRQRACNVVPIFKNLLTLSTDNFLIDLVSMLNDGDNPGSIYSGITF